MIPGFASLLALAPIPGLTPRIARQARRRAGWSPEFHAATRSGGRFDNGPAIAGDPFLRVPALSGPRGRSA